MNKKGILAALVVLAAAGGGYVISKKYDIGMDDISATIAYLEARTIGTSPEIITADSPTNAFAPTPAPTPADTPPANGSADEEYHFSPDIIVHGSDTYKEKVQKALDELKGVDIDEYNEVMKYLEVVRERGDSTVGKGVRTITEKVLDSNGPSVFVHEKEHEKQNIEPQKSYYEGKSGWYMELDVVKKATEFDAKAHNYTEEQKLQRFKQLIKPFESRYPKEYKQFFSEK